LKPSKRARCVPLERPIGFSTRTLNRRYYTLVKIRADGLTGIGFCYAGHRAGTLSTLAVRELFRELLIGQDPTAVEALWDRMFRESLLHGRRGAVLRALSAVDIAIWDLLARAAGLPLYRYLGAFREGWVPAYASGGYYGDGKTADDLAAECAEYVAAGFKAVKIKVGRLTPSDDAARLAAVRRAVGEGVQIFLDANNAWTTAEEAVRAIRCFEPFNPGWIEEPLPPDDIDGHAVVARATRVPVATGEVEGTRWGFKALLERGAAAVIQPDAAVCGGITEFRRIAALAAAFSVPVAPHWFHQLHAHLVAATPNAIWVEYFRGHEVFNFGRLLAVPDLQVENGGLKIPEHPGHGVELDEGAVSRWALDGWG
jgi:L-alanine-DL-glutamate epimerase-like enolase superfamily enzyme